MDTGFIGDHFDYLTNPVTALPEQVFILAALFLKDVRDADTPWKILANWQMNLAPTYIFALKLEGAERTFFLRLQYEKDQIEIRSPLGTTTINATQINGGPKGQVGRDGNLISIEFAGQSYQLIQIDPNETETAQADFSGSLTAPLPGKVIRVELKAGDRVEEGQAIVILESMKMECSIQAPSDGIIGKLLVGVDDTVEEGDELVVIAALSESD